MKRRGFLASLFALPFAGKAAKPALTLTNDVSPAEVFYSISDGNWALGTKCPSLRIEIKNSAGAEFKDFTVS